MNYSYLFLKILFFLAVPFHSLFAATVSVYGPQKLTASTAGKTTTQNFTHSLNGGQGVITVINGDGTTISPESCAGLSFVRNLLCQVKNVVMAVKMWVQRPSSIQISLNGLQIMTSTQLPPQTGKYQTSVIVNKTNSLVVTLKGSPSSYITVDVKAENLSPNVLPIANFSFTPDDIIAPAMVSFSGLTSSDSDGTIANYAWDFSDGSFATGSIVSHSFQNSCTYNVKLTVTDDRGGTNSKIQTVLVKENQPPIAQFSVNSDSNLGIMKAYLDASGSTDPDGTISEYLWDFGDQQTSTGVLVEHTYASPGTYTINLRVTDNRGTSVSKSLSLVMKDLAPPIVTLQNPGDGSTVSQGQIAILGTANEKISRAVIIKEDGTSLPLVIANTGLSFSGNVLTSVLGSQTWTIKVQDLAGNESLKPVHIYVGGSGFWNYSECSIEQGGL